MQEFLSRSPEDTKEFASRVIAFLTERSGVRGTGTLVALQGDLGAGKTVFAKGVAESLGVTDTVTSPTFVIEKIYDLPEGVVWKRLVHIDAYRLDGEDDLVTIGWNELATDPNNLVLVEWPEQVGLGVPERALWLEFETVNDTTRKIRMPDTVTFPDNE